MVVGVFVGVGVVVVVGGVVMCEYEVDVSLSVVECWSLVVLWWGMVGVLWLGWGGISYELVC